MAYQFGRLPQDSDFTPNIRKQYIWLYIPLLAWISLIFPLFFIPIPIFFLGPFGFFIMPSTTRRKQMMIFQRCDLALHKEPATYSWAFERWMADVGVNLLDIATLGLSSAFALANRYDAMKISSNDEAVRTEEKAVNWLIRWILLGNVFFLLAYIICPGIVLEQILYRIERHLYRQYQPLDEKLDTLLGTVTYRTIATREELDQLSANSPVLLYCRFCLPEAEDAIRAQLKDLTFDLLPDLLPEKIQIGFCNTYTGILTHSTQLTDSLRKEKIFGEGFFLFSEGKVVSQRNLNVSQPQEIGRLANLARQTIGAPEAAIFPIGRIDPPGTLLRTLSEAVTQSESRPVLILTFSGGKNMTGFNILAIRDEVIPEIREGLKNRGIALYYTNSSHVDDPNLARWLGELNMRSRGFIYLKGGSVEQTKSFGAFSLWSDLVKALMPIIGISTPAMNNMTSLRYYVVASPAEAERISRRQPLIVVARPAVDSTKPFDETRKVVLPDLIPAVEAKGGVVALYQGTPKAEGWLKQGVTLLIDGAVINSISIKTEVGDGYWYSEAGKGLISSLAESGSPAELKHQLL